MPKRSHSQTEEQLALFKMVVDTSPIVLFRWRAAEGWPVDFVSDNIERMFGYTPDELLSGTTPYASIVHPDDLARVAEEVSAYTAENVDRFEQEYRIIAKDGSVHWTLDYTYIIRDAKGNATHYQGTVQDVTEQKQFEERQRQILGTMPVGIIMTQPTADGKVLYANQEFANMIGKPIAELLNSTVPDLYFDPKDRPRVLKLVQEQGYVQNYAVRGKRADGSMFWADLSIQPTTFAGEMVLLVALVDVTDRRIGEAERERYTTQLSTASQIATQVSTILEPDKLLHTVIPLIKEQFDLYYVHVYTVDDASKTLNLRSGYGEPGQVMLAQGHSIPLDREQSLVATAARSQKPVLVNDVTEDPNFLPNPLLPDTKSEVAVPIVASGRVLGVFDVQHDQVNYFTDADLDAFQTLAGQIATALQNAQFVEQVERNLFETEARLEVSQALAEAQTEDQVLDAIMQVSGFYPKVFSSVYLFDFSSTEPTAVVSRIEPFESGVVQTLPLGTHLTAQQFTIMDMISPDAPFVSDVVDEDERVDAMTRSVVNQSGAVSMAIVPINAGGEWLGALVQSCTEPGYFDERKMYLYQSLAEQGAVALFSARLRERVARTQAAVDNSRDSLMLLDDQARIVDTNETACQMLGYTRAELLTMTLFDIDTQVPKPAFDEMFQALLNSRELPFIESQQKTKDGKVFPVEVSVNLVEFGGQQYAYAMSRDITERREAEATIQQSQRFLNSILEQNPYSMWISDAQGIMLRQNQACRDLFNITDELVGVYSIRKDNIVETQGAMPTLESVYEEGKIAHFQLRYETSELEQLALGSHFRIIDVTVAPIMNEQGEVVNAIIVHNDITQREHYAELLGTASEIAAQANAILDPDEVLNTVIPLLKERFDLYYAHVYTLEGNTLNLRAGYGEPGQVMLERGHSIPLDRETSLVATAARTKELVHVPDVTENPNFLPNDLLPDTKTEVAVPLVVGDQVLGVFDIQHDVPNYFTQTYLNVFTTLAGQIAITLRNAQIVDQTERQRALYDGILTNLPTAVFAVDSQFNLLATNEAAGKLLSREMTDKEGDAYVEQYDVVYYDTGERFPETELPLVRANTLGGQHTNSEMAVKHPDGMLVPLMVNAGPLLDPAGEQMGAVVTFTDMTVQRAAQQAIRESQQRLSLLIARSPLAIIEWDLNFEVAAWNPAAETIFGYTAEEAMGRHAAGLMVPEEVRELVNQIWQNLLDQKGGEHSINDNFTKDGRTITCEWFNTPLVDANGKTLGVTSLVADITERQNLQREQARLTDILENTSDLVSTSTPDGKLTYLNPAGYRMVGWPEDESLEGHVIPDLHTDAALKLIEAEGIPTTLEKGIWQGETAVQRRDGTVIPVYQLIMAHRDVNGELNYLSTIMRDMTEQKQSEQALRDSEAFLKNVFDGIQDGINVLDKDFQVVRTNAWMQKMYGEESFLAGKKCFSVYQGRESVCPWCPSLPALESGEMCTEIVPYPSADDPQGWIELTGYPLRDADGQITGVIEYVKDISERRMAQLERERFAEQLGTAAQISAELSAILDPDSLFETLVQLTKERLGFYHVQFYDLDEATQTLMLRVGYGRAGETMKRQGHKLSLTRGKGIAVRAAVEKAAVVAQDLSQEADYVPNMLLLEAQSEAAVPLVVGERVLGVLDVVSNHVGDFTESAVNVLQTLIAQVATTYQNVLYFELQLQSQGAVRDYAEQIRAMFDAILDGVIVSNMVGEITDTNEASLTLLGYENREDFLGRNILECIAMNDRAKASEGWVTALEAGSSGVRSVKFVQKDESVVEGELTAALLRDAEGNPIGFVNVARPFSGRA